MASNTDSSLPHLEQLRKQAKELLKAHRAGDGKATQRFRKALTKFGRMTVGDLQTSRLCLADAQHVLARERGFPSWPTLVARVAVARDRGYGFLEAALAGNLTNVAPSPDDLRATCAKSLHLACAVADVEAVESSNASVRATAGPLDASPLIYLCASRHQRGDRECAARRVHIARLLLARGADPNASYRDLEHFDGTRIALSAAAKNVGSVELLEVLVAGGANVHDHSALWATAALEHPVDSDPLSCLKFLLKSKPPHWILNGALAASVKRNSKDAVELLLEAGASPNTGGGWGGSGTLLHQAILLDADRAILERLFQAGNRQRRNREGHTPLEVARRVDHSTAVALLTELGEVAREASPADLAIAAALRGERGEIARYRDNPVAFQCGDHRVLLWALRSGRADAVLDLLAIGLDPNVRDDDGRTALALAQDLDAHDAVELLARAGARMESFDFELVPEPLFDTFESAAQAIVDGDLDALRRFLSNEPELIRWRSRRPHRATLLHYIGANGLETERQKTPPNAVEVLQFLLEQGAEADALCATYGGGPAQTTLALLSSSGWPQKAGLSRPLVLTLCAGGANPNGIEEDGVPLATAIAFSSGEAVAGLVEAGARVDNVLFAAATGRVDLVERDIPSNGTLRAGAPLCRVDWFASNDDPTYVASKALLIASSCNQPDVVRLLLERGVDPCARPEGGETPLHSAAYAGHSEIVRTLLDAGADPHLKDPTHGSTAFGWALEGKRTKVIDVLLEYTKPSLFDAVDIGLVDITREHLERDPSLVNAPEGRGGLLLWSAECGRREMVELLLEFGADPSVKNSRGQTPKDLAEAGGHHDLARRLAR